MINVIGGELYQYDTGRQIQITSKKNYIIDEVHFCNDDLESAFVCKAIYDEPSASAIAHIPNILLQSDKDLIVYATIITDDSRRTVERSSFHIHKRKRPDDYVYTETEVFLYKNLEDRIKKLEELPVDSEVVTNAIKEYMDKNPVKTVTKVSELENDSGYLTEVPSEYVTNEELEDKGFATKNEIPNVPVKSVNGKIGDVSLNASDVGAEENGKVDEHNVSGDSHNDIRLLIEGLTSRLNALADSDDTTLDQLSEVVAYIKSNKDLINAVTTNKISYSDIVDNLTTNISNKPLSAAQGVVLQSLFDSIKVPTKVSDLDNDKGYLTEHQDLSNYYTKQETDTAIEEATKENQWELIEAFTLEEDMKAIERTAFPDGTIYNLSALKVIAKFYYPLSAHIATRFDVYSGG